TARPGEDNQLLAYYQSSYIVSCSSVATGDVDNIKISFSRYAAGRYTDTVPLKDKNGNVLADIRGIRGTGTGFCDNNPDRIQFTGQQYAVPAAQGTHSFPLTWSLCSNNATDVTGEGTANVTATLT
ncbi:hypothetical protein DNV23_24820, partial [Salmonella enterica subsp. enterica serovar Hadar]|nr:hypothetical protein [Salmonella enterica subsp. enterica serovar Hadar]